MSASPPYPEPAAPRRVATVADLGTAEAARAAGADALAVEAADAPGLVASLRARWPDPAIHAALDGPEDPGLDAAMAERPDGVLLRDARSGRDVAALGARLAVFEAEAGLPDGSIAILAVIHHPLGVLDARSFVGASPRLSALGLDGAALATCLGEGTVLAQARGMIRIAAAAAGVMPLEVLETKTNRVLTPSPQDAIRWNATASGDFPC